MIEYDFLSTNPTDENSEDCETPDAAMVLDEDDELVFEEGEEDSNNFDYGHTTHHPRVPSGTKKRTLTNTWPRQLNEEEGSIQQLIPRKVEQRDPMEDCGDESQDSKFSSFDSPAQKMKCGNNRHWTEVMPLSLREVYDEQKFRYSTGKDAPSPLNTYPLRELVRSLHEKAKGEVKYFI